MASRVRLPEPQLDLLLQLCRKAQILRADQIRIADFFDRFR